MTPEDEEQVFAEIAEREEFLALVSSGVPTRLAAYKVRWTPKQLKRMLADPEFAELIDDATERSLDGIEATLHRKAEEGNMAAIQMVLFNRRPRSWRDVRKIELTGRTEVTVVQVEATRRAAIELLRERGAGVMQALTAGIDDVIDAEVIEDATDVD